MTLEDLRLSPTEELVLKACDAPFRHALWKSGEHMALTAYPECCRKTAVALREYQRKLTLTDRNRIPTIDDTQMDKAQERAKEYFKPR